jgi:membrane protein insertase Oxa1/YidC/SpoIIIJ
MDSMISGHQQIEQVIRNWEEKQEVHKQEVMHLEDVHNKNNIVILNLKTIIVKVFFTCWKLWKIVQGR